MTTRVGLHLSRVYHGLCALEVHTEAASALADENNLGVAVSVAMVADLDALLGGL